jgi:hypothetical protein
MKECKFLPVLLAVGVFFFLPSSVPAQEETENTAAAPSLFQGIEIFHDTLWIGNSDTDSAPSPIKGVWGVSAKFYVFGNWYFIPDIGFYYTEYLYRDGTAYPAEIEAADAVGTFDILFSCAAFYKFAPAENFAILAGTGPAFSFKIPITSYGNAPTGEVGSYFLERGRFFHWELKAVLEWNVFPVLDFCVRARVILPIYRLWDGDNLPIYDGLMAGAGIGLRLKF